MPYNVSSWFKEQSVKSGLEPVRKFMIGSSDYSAYVMKWPRFEQKWDDIRPQNVTIDLANESQTFNFILDNPAKLNTTCQIQAGFTHPTSGDELVTVHQGKMERVRWRDGKVSLTVVDKFQQLSDRQVGTDDTPVSYESSNYLPSEIAWWLVSSHGGFSSVRSSSNPDIDYDSWKAWSDIFSDDAVYMHARFDGIKVTEALRHIARMTRSAIYVDDNKFRFHRFSIIDSLTQQYGDDEIMGLELEIDDQLIVNKQYVPGGYDPTSGSYAFTVSDVSTSSVNSYGLREDSEKDEKVWYINSGSALNLAQRLIQTNAEPYGQFSFDTGLHGLSRRIGDHVSLTDSFLSIGARTYRIMAKRVDMDKGGISFDVDESQQVNGFRLDYSALDSSDVLV